jgi:hypothetical protein
MKDAFAASPTLAKTKIYLGGRLVGRGKGASVTPAPAKKKPAKKPAAKKSAKR